MRAEADEILRFTGEDDRAVGKIAVKQRADADGVARGDKGIGRGIIDNHGKFRIKPGKHVGAVFLPQGENDLAVGIGCKHIALGLECLFDRAEAVQFTVAHGHITAAMERLHALGMQTHDGQPMEAQHAAACGFEPRIVRAAGFRFFKIRENLFLFETGGRKTKNCAHKKHLRIICAALPKINFRTNCCRSAVPPNLLEYPVSFPGL